MIPDRVKAIIRDVADEHGVTARDIVGPSRMPHLIPARYKAIRLVRDISWGRGSPSIRRLSEWFGRCPESIRYALRHVGTITPNGGAEAQDARAWADCRARLAWLYGDADARIAKNAPDLAAWNALGDPVRAEARG